MSQPGPLSIGSITDLVRILQEHPEWREQLRTLLLSDELLQHPRRFEEFVQQEHLPLQQAVQTLTEQMTQLTRQVSLLAHHLEQLTQRMERVEAQIEALTQRVNDLTQRMERVEAQIEALTQRVNDLTQRMERVEAQIEALTQRVNDLTQRMERVEAQIEALTQRVNDLTQRMERVEAQIEALTQRVNDLTQRVNDLTQRMDELTQRVNDLTQRMIDLTERMERAERDLGELKGAMQELRAAQKAPAYFANLGFYRIKAFEPVELGERLEKALEENQLTPEEYQDLMQLDLIVVARRVHEPHLYLFAVEVSWTVDSYDVERAVRRAQLLHKLYADEKPTIQPVAWGTRFTAQAQDQAHALGVKLLLFERPR